MLAWHGWLIVALLLFLLELLGTGFFSFALGVAALIAMIGAWLGVGITAQCFIFAIAALVLAPLLKRVFRRFAPSRRTSFLAGESRQQQGEITQLESGEYRINVEGDLFMVRSNSNAPLVLGATVVIRRFDGITAIID